MTLSRRSPCCHTRTLSPTPRISPGVSSASRTSYPTLRPYDGLDVWHDPSLDVLAGVSVLNHLFLTSVENGSSQTRRVSYPRLLLALFEFPLDKPLMTDMEGCHLREAEPPSASRGASMSCMSSRHAVFSDDSITIQAHAGCSNGSISL